MPKPFLAMLLVAVLGAVVLWFLLAPDTEKQLAGFVLLGSLTVASLETFVLLIWVAPRGTLGAISHRDRRREVLGRQLGPANWDFSQSWASNLTLAGALFGTILADSALVPSPTAYIEEEAYGWLNILFAIMTVLSPLAYAGLGSVHAEGVANGQRQVRHHGTRLSFVIASWLTLWAVIGQMVTLGILLWEIQRAGKLPPGGPVVVAAVCTTGILLVMLYYWKTAWKVLEESRAPRQEQPSWSPL